MSIIYTGTHFTGSRPIVQDTNGRIWVFYTKNNQFTGTSHYKYSDDNGETWSSEQNFPSANAVQISVDVDSANTLHFYYRKNNRSIYHRRRTSAGSWSSEEVVKTYNSTEVYYNGTYYNLFVGHVACYGTTSYCLAVRINTSFNYYLELLYKSGSWQLQSISNHSSTITWTQIEFDSSGQACIIYVKSADVYRMWRSSAGVLSSEAKINDSHNSDTASLIIRPDDYFEVLASNDSQDALRRYYAQYNSSWSFATEKVGATIDGAWHTWLDNAGTGDQFYVTNTAPATPPYTPWKIEIKAETDASWTILDATADTVTTKEIIFNKYSSPHDGWYILLSDSSTTELYLNYGSYFGFVGTNTQFVLTPESISKVEYQYTYGTGELPLNHNPESTEKFEPTYKYTGENIFYLDSALSIVFFETQKDVTDLGYQDEDVKIHKGLKAEDTGVGSEEISTPIFVKDYVGFKDEFKLAIKPSALDVVGFSDSVIAIPIIHQRDIVAFSDDVEYKTICRKIKWLIDRPYNKNFSFDDFKDNFTFENIELVEKHNEKYHNHAMKVTFKNQSSLVSRFYITISHRQKDWRRQHLLEGLYKFFTEFYCETPDITPFQIKVYRKGDMLLLAEFDSTVVKSGWNYWDATINFEQLGIQEIFIEVTGQGAEVIFDNFAFVKSAQIRNPSRFLVPHRDTHEQVRTLDTLTFTELLNHTESTGFSLEWQLVDVNELKFLKSLYGQKIFIRTHDVSVFAVLVTDVVVNVHPRYEELTQKYDVKLDCYVY